MKTKMLFSAMLLLCAYTNFAQETADEFYSKDIGFNTTFLFQGIFQSNSTPFSLMYKKYTSKNTATRFGFDISLDLDANSGANSNYYQENDFGMFGLTFGKEFQRPINTKWVWFYGGDLIPYYRFSKGGNFLNGAQYYKYESTELGGIVRPFLAIRYNINPRLYLSAEASLSFKYAKTSNNASNPQDGTTAQDAEHDSLQINMNPATGLFLYYKF